MIDYQAFRDATVSRTLFRILSREASCRRAEIDLLKEPGLIGIFREQRLGVDRL